MGEGGGTIGGGTKLQARMPRVRFPIMSLEFVIDLILQACTTQPQTGMSTRNISWEVGLTTLPPRSLNLLETSGPVQAYAGFALPFSALVGLHVEYPLFSDFNETSIFRQIFEKFSNIKFHEICPVGDELFHADG